MLSLYFPVRSIIGRNFKFSTVISFDVTYTYVQTIYTYVKRKRNEADNLFDALNSYHPNIKFTLEQNPKKVLDTHIIFHIRFHQNANMQCSQKYEANKHGP